MTRDEAVAKLKAVKNHGDYTFNRTMSAHGLVDGLNALGILKLDEPISAHERFVSEMKKAGYHSTSMAMADIRTALESANLRIVEK